MLNTYDELMIACDLLKSNGFEEAARILLLNELTTYSYVDEQYNSYWDEYGSTKMYFIGPPDLNKTLSELRKEFESWKKDLYKTPGKPHEKFARLRQAISPIKGELDSYFMGWLNEFYGLRYLEAKPI